MKFKLTKNLRPLFRRESIVEWRHTGVYKGYVISLFAGEYAFSFPKESLSSPDKYERVELCIMNEEGNMPPYEEMQQFFDIVGYGDWPQTKQAAAKYEEFGQGEHSFHVFPYVPVEKLDNLFDYLNQ